MSVLSSQQYKVYEKNQLEKWAVFDNCFKIGNYLQTRAKSAFAKVKYYSLEVSF